MKLPILSGKEIAKILEKAGFMIVGQKGSHLRMKREESSPTDIVVVPLHDEVARGTLRHILTKAGMSREEFFELL